MRYHEINKYSEGPESTVTHDGQLYSVDQLLKWSSAVPVVEFDITRLLWMYDGQELDQERVDNADLSFSSYYHTLE